MKKQNLFLGLTALAVLLISSLQSSGNVWRVNNNPALSQWANHQVFTGTNALQQAISSNSVSSGDTLYLEASAIAYASATITNKKLTIIGTGYFLNSNLNLQNNQISSTCYQLIFGLGSDSSTIMGVEFTFGAGAGIYIGNNSINNITINRCYIPNEIGLTANSGYTLNNIVINQCFLNVINTGASTVNGLILTNNYFNALGIGTNVVVGTTSISQNLIALDVSIWGHEFSNNIVYGNIYMNNNSSANVFNNIFVLPQPWLTGGNNNFGLQTSYFLIGGGTIDGMYMLQNATNCPECYHGYPWPSLPGVEIGMYGGSNPYHLSGIPNIPTIYNLQAPANIPQGGILQSTISTKSNN